MVLAAFWCEPLKNSDEKEIKNLYRKVMSGHKTVNLSDVI